MGEKLTERINLACSPRDLGDWTARSKKSGHPLSEWIRHRLAELDNVETMTPQEFAAWKIAGDALKEWGR